jgi:invasion protein IalB
MEIAMAKRRSRQAGRAAVFLTGVFIAACAGGAANGQQPARPAAAAKDAETAIEARGARELRPLTYSGWRKLCFRPSETDMVCRTSIAGVTDSGQDMLRVDLIEAGDGQGARLQIFLPPMLFLEAGVRVSFDQGEAVDIPFAWCFSNVCVAAHRVDASFIRQMKTGQTMTLKVVDSRVTTVTTSLPLERFAAVNQGPPDLLFGRSLEAMSVK